MNIIILGKPGCGKGTQAKLMIKKYNLHHFSSGEYFRNKLKKGTKLGEEIREIMSSPNLVLDKVANKVAVKVIKDFTLFLVASKASM